MSDGAATDTKIFQGKEAIKNGIEEYTYIIPIGRFELKNDNKSKFL